MNFTLSTAVSRTAFITVLLAAGLSLAQPALANPSIPGAASGACVPALQSVPLGAAPSPVTCTFHFVDAHGKPVAGGAINPVVTGELGQISNPATTTDDNGVAKVFLAAPSCAKIGQRLGTVLATRTGTAVSAQAVAVVTCGNGPLVVDRAACMNTDRQAAALVHPNGTELLCAFHTQPRGGLDVSFGLTEAGSSKTAFIVAQSAQPDRDGNFEATVWNYGRSVTVVATVTSDRTFPGAASVTRTIDTPDKQT